jgi:hypothetical protein
LDETIQTLATLDILEMYILEMYNYNKTVGPDYPDPEIEAPIETALMEETKTHNWASACIMLRVIRFPSNSKWIVHRENGNVFPRMVLQ